MRDSGNLTPDHHMFHFLLLGCANAKWVVVDKQTHNWVVIFDDALIRLYVECKVLDDAQKV